MAIHSRGRRLQTVSSGLTAAILRRLLQALVVDDEMMVDSTGVRAGSASDRSIGADASAGRSDSVASAANCSKCDEQQRSYEKHHRSVVSTSKRFTSPSIRPASCASLPSRLVKLTTPPPPPPPRRAQPRLRRPELSASGAFTSQRQIFLSFVGEF